MEEIGSYEAKTHLAALIERVEAGERFTITRHGRSVAELNPIASKARPDIDALQQRAQQLRDALACAKGALTHAEIVAAIGEGRR